MTNAKSKCPWCGKGIEIEKLPHKHGKGKHGKGTYRVIKGRI